MIHWQPLFFLFLAAFNFHGLLKACRDGNDLWATVFLIAVIVAMARVFGLP